MGRVDYTGLTGDGKSLLHRIDWRWEELITQDSEGVVAVRALYLILTEWTWLLDLSKQQKCSTDSTFS